MYDQASKIDDSFIMYGEGWNMPTAMDDHEKGMEDNHRKMLNSARAAQFMPFAALTGYSEAIQDASITTDQKKDFLLSFQEMSITETAGAAAWHSTHEARCH